jgi:hypothetical protein
MQKESRYSLSGVSSKNASPTKSYANNSSGRRLSGKSQDDTAASKRSSEVGQRPEGGAAGRLSGGCQCRCCEQGSPATKHLAGVYAERVRVFVRVRPTKPEETPGGLKMKPGGKGVVIYRE